MATEKNYTDCDGLNAMEGICYQKRSYTIAKEFEELRLNKFNKMYSGKN